MDKKRIFLKPEQTIPLLGNRKEIHTFRQGGPILIGCNINRGDMIKMLRKYRVEIGGEQCRKFNHGLVMHYNGLLYIEVDDCELKKLDK